MARRGSPRGGLPGFFERMGLRCLANMAGGGGGGSSETTADPEPIFLTQPRITPRSGIANQDEFTGALPTVSFGSISSYRWMLNGDPISTGLKALPSVAGTLVFEVTANGPGGSATAQSEAVTINAAAPAPTPTPTPSPPAFSVLPSISPASGTAGATTFTASDGTISGSTGTTRRWLLNGVSIGTLGTVLSADPGNLVLEVTATGPGGSAVATSSAVTVAPTPTPTPSPAIPTVLPGAGWAGTANTALIPAQNWTPYGTVDDSIWPNAQFTLGDLAVVEGETYIRAFGDTTAEDGTDKLYAAFEDGTEVEVPWAAHPVTGIFDYLFMMGDGTGRNGVGRLRLRVVPKNGLERVYWKSVVKNDNPGGAGYITRVNRYVDPSKPDDSGDGLTWATAKKTTYAAINSFSLAERTNNICRVNLKQGTVPWFEQNGKNSGTPLRFTYRPEFIGEGRKDEATETKLSFRNQAKSPTDATESWQFRWQGLGPRPYFSNMLIDWAKIVIYYTGAYYENFDEISDLGPSGALDANGFPYGVHKSETGNNDITNANSWRDGSAVTGYLPGEAGRWGGERNTKANYTSTHYQPSTIQERWDGEELYSADCVFVNGEGDWLLENVIQTQGVQLEIRAHVETEISVVSVQPNTPSTGKTTITFTGTFTEALPNEVNNIFVRVIESANGVASGDVDYPTGANGSKLVSTLGYWVDASTTANRNLPFASHQLIVNDSGNRLANLLADDLLRVYIRYHGDAGQTNYDTATGADTRANRENISLRNRKVITEQSQPYLVQIGSLSSATTTSNSTVPAAIPGYTVSTSGRIATFDPAVPGALKQHGWIEPKGGLSTLQSRRVVRVLSSTQVYLDESFTKDSDGSDYDLPAGTAFAGYRGIHGFIEAGSLLHKAGDISVLQQFQHGLSGSGFLHSTYPGWTAAGAGATIRPGVANWKRGGFDIRWINSIILQVGHDFSTIPSDVRFINSHVERGLPDANATILNTDAGIVFGYPSLGGPALRGYVPDLTMTRLVATPYIKRRQNGQAIAVGDRIGAF